MKSYTDLEQSKKLAEFLPLESADMGYIPSAEDDDGNTLYTAEFKSEFIFDEDCIPCWSLAALSEFILPYITDDDGDIYKFYLSKDDLDRWIAYYKSDDVSIYICEESDNMIDVILEMVCWLKKEEYI